MIEHLLLTFAPDHDNDSAEVLRRWLEEPPAIITSAPRRLLRVPDWATCTTSTGSSYAALCAGDVPMTLDGAVSDDIAAAMKPIVVRYVSWTS